MNIHNAPFYSNSIINNYSATSSSSTRNNKENVSFSRNIYSTTPAKTSRSIKPLLWFALSSVFAGLFSWNAFTNIAKEEKDRAAEYQEYAQNNVNNKIEQNKKSSNLDYSKLADSLNKVQQKNDSILKAKIDSVNEENIKKKIQEYEFQQQQIKALEAAQKALDDSYKSTTLIYEFN